MNFLEKNWIAPRLTGNGAVPEDWTTNDPEHFGLTIYERSGCGGSHFPQ
jgi:hypothetical protein